MPRAERVRLPELLQRKIYKTGQTRGADDDEIYQNRVARNSTVLIRFGLWCSFYHGVVADDPEFFERGYIVLVSPLDYIELGDEGLEDYDLYLGENALLFYETREEWAALNPDVHGFREATSRVAPLGGVYCARIHGTTATDESGEQIRRGFTTTGRKGAGIRAYEYAKKATIDDCRDQLSALYWMCENSVQAAIEYGMTPYDAENAYRTTMRVADRKRLLDGNELRRMRMIDYDGFTICPLCLERLDARGFYSRKAQAEGRETYDLTITEINLFHIEELRPGLFNHRIYNLGWGHHHCNVVVADEGLDHTLEWMCDTLAANVEAGYFDRSRLPW